MNHMLQNLLRSVSPRRALPMIAFGAAALLSTSAARADLAGDLGALDAQAGALRDALGAVSVPTGSLCGSLSTLTSQSSALASQATRIDDNLAAPLSVDAPTLDALEQLSQTSVELAGKALQLSKNVQAQQGIAASFNLKDDVVAVLQLADDIGTMADRIGEMSDKILVMSDDIGTMADRILVTQQIQSENYQLTLGTILQTQTNALTLVSVVEAGTGNLSLSGLVTQGKQLASTMSAVVLSPLTMAKSLSSVATNVHTLLGQVNTARSALLATTAKSTLTTGSTALSQLADLPLMLTSLGTAVSGYTLALSSVSIMTPTSTLVPSLQSLLQISADIGMMANRILEMANLILAMSDNIGAEADQILAVQQTLSLDVAGTQASMLGAQTLAITLIAQRSR